MLHVAPQRRPTAVQLLKHPWVLQNINTSVSTILQEPLHQNKMSESHLKETVANTYRAIAGSPKIAHLGPVAMSELARRRFKDKALERLQHT